MNMKRTMTMLVLITALLMTVSWAQADELPAQEANNWAPVGDLVGTENHATVTGQILDPYGFEPKYAEDWQLNDKVAPSLLFGLYTIGENGNIIFMRSYGGTQLDGSTNGHVTFGSKQPGYWGFNFDLRGYDFRSDTTSEMRALSFAAGPPPPALDMVPGLNWTRAKFNAKQQVNHRFFWDGGLARTGRSGSKGSLLRNSVGAAVPGVKDFNLTSNELWIRGNLNEDAFAGSLSFNVRDTEGSRSLDIPHDYVDDQLLWKFQLDANYDFTEGTQLMAGGMYSKLTNEQTELLAGNAFLPDNEAKTTAGQLGVQTRIGASSRVSFSGQFKSQDTSGQTLNQDLSLAEAMTRDRSSSLYKIKASTNAIKNTRIQAHYKYLSSDLNEVVSMDALPGSATDYQATDQERSKQDLGLKFRSRFSRKVSLRGGVRWQDTSITESTTGEGAGIGWLYTMGDRDINRLKWDLGLNLKLSPDFKFDIGYENLDQTFDRVDLGNLETNWVAKRAYAAANWAVVPTLSILASASLGQDKYEMVNGPTSTGTMGPLLYDGTTFRFAPAINWRFARKWNVEGIYEGVNFEDEGDNPDTQLKSDYDRWQVRVAFDATEQARLTAGYRRLEFDENHWDDYILDIYSLSVSGKF